MPPAGDFFDYYVGKYRCQVKSSPDPSPELLSTIFSLFHDYFISLTMTAFCACSRFSASSKISSACASNTFVVISSSR